MNKKAQGMSLTTIILIVLGLVVLIFLIYGFSTGWANLWDRITQYTGGESNVDTIKQACVLACSTNSADAYCNQLRTVKFGEERTTWNGTHEIEDTKVIVSCDALSKEPKYGVSIDSCPSITC